MYVRNKHGIEQINKTICKEMEYFRVMVSSKDNPLMHTLSKSIEYFLKYNEHVTLKYLLQALMTAHAPVTSTQCIEFVNRMLRSTSNQGPMMSRPMINMLRELSFEVIPTIFRQYMMLSCLRLGDIDLLTSMVLDLDDKQRIEMIPGMFNNAIEKMDLFKEQPPHVIMQLLTLLEPIQSFRDGCSRYIDILLKHGRDDVVLQFCHLEHLLQQLNYQWTPLFGKFRLDSSNLAFLKLVRDEVHGRVFFDYPLGEPVTISNNMLSEALMRGDVECARYMIENFGKCHMHLNNYRWIVRDMLLTDDVLQTMDLLMANIDTVECSFTNLAYRAISEKRTDVIDRLIKYVADQTNPDLDDLVQRFITNHVNSQASRTPITLKAVVNDPFNQDKIECSLWHSINKMDINHIDRLLQSEKHLGRPDAVSGKFLRTDIIVYFADDKNLPYIIGMSGDDFNNIWTRMDDNVISDPRVHQLIAPTTNIFIINIHIIQHILDHYLSSDNNPMINPPSIGLAIKMMEQHPSCISSFQDLLDLFSINPINTKWQKYNNIIMPYNYYERTNYFRYAYEHGHLINAKYYL
ncbi:hypothetical protein SAMD00019534_006840 [Acytostelium subglobosum LB1]|uniref:hypothetical protein n=1 Tax=Acytostelium subglobosum LB1 TaxID=1410327 RepID=UPI000644AD62|nr:hypothetical protein SAMD00019534_006840 [Acytostelium subglobosum LB1]GAM17509.1 hypothetical protein SAMD00019534_006840 [Acytostelium subglobosum LB1]|eukprot:XP_012759571.1 hypothetical protein SAMD00019534_006840 [Acytostelium subglobosum LB1]